MSKMTAGPAPERALSPVPILACVVRTHRLYKANGRTPRAMSARLDAVGCTERQTLPIPFGHHVYVVSDLSLSPTTDANSRPVQGLRAASWATSTTPPWWWSRATSSIPSPPRTSSSSSTRRWRPCRPCATRSRPSPRTCRHRFIVLPGSDDRRTAAQPGGPRATRTTRRQLRERPDVAGRHGQRRARPRGRAPATAPSRRSEPTSTIAPTPTDLKTRTRSRVSSPRACSIAGSVGGCGSRRSRCSSSTS